VPAPRRPALTPPARPPSSHARITAASDVSRVKAGEVRRAGFCGAGFFFNVLENVRLIAQAARDAAITSRLIDVCHVLYAEPKALGLGGADMIAVIRAPEERTAALGASTTASPITR